MKLKVFTLRFSPETGEFDASALERFLEHRDVVSVFEHFLTRDGEPMWAVMLGYRESPAGRPAVKRGGAKPDWRSGLSESDGQIFDLLRRWRNERAQKDGKPPYVLLTNKQIARVARSHPSSIAELRDVEGIGDARIESFGDELLELVTSSAESDPQTQGDGDED